MTGILNLLAGAVGVLKDTYFNLTTLLLPGDGTNGAQNNTFLDSSSNNFSITRNGNTTQGTFSPFSQTGWSTNFVRSATAANNTRLLVASNSGLGLSSNNFCIELWAYFTSAYTGDGPFCGNVTGTGFVANTFWFGPHNTNSGKVTVYIYNYSSSTYFLAEATDPPLNQWVHYALVRNGNTFTIYRNGVSTASGTFSGAVTGASSSLFISRSGDNSIANSSFDGYMSNLRVVNGSSVYTSSFTPPTSPLTAITNTGLLTLQSNRWVDNSTNSAAITVDSGTPSIQAFSPFAPTAAYDAATNGGSGYFDGSGDYLVQGTSTTDFNLSTGDWTIDFWVYKTAASDGNIVNLYNTAGNTSGLSVWVGSNGAVHVDNGVTGAINAGNTGINTWAYVCVSRASGTTTAYVNGSSIGTTTQAPNAAQYGSFGRATDGTLSNTGYISGLRIIKGTALSGSVPTSPPTAITNTKLLLNFTNAGITDATAKNVLETVGNAQISTTQSKWGGSSIYLDGTGDYLIPSPNAATLNAFGTGDFTVEFWMNSTSFANADNIKIIFDCRPLSTDGVYPTIYFSSGQIRYFVNNVDRITGSTLNTSQWYHVALCRSGTSTKLFVDGTQVGSTYTDTNNYLCGANRPVVGCRGHTLGDNNYYGYIDDFRITRYARYTANFTPPTQAFALQ